MIEGNDPRDYAERITNGEVDAVELGGRDALALEGERQAGEVAQLIDGNTVIPSHHTDGTAIVNCVEPGQFVSISLDRIGQGHDIPPAFSGWAGAPGCKGSFGRRNSAIGVTGRRARQPRYRRSRRRGDGLKRALPFGLAEFAVD